MPNRHSHQVYCLDRLTDSNVTEEQAEEACAKLGDALSTKDCMYDSLVVLKNDLAGSLPSVQDSSASSERVLASELGCIQDYRPCTSTV